MTQNDLPEELHPKQSDFKRWQTESRIRALTAIVKFLLVILLALVSFNLGRYSSNTTSIKRTNYMLIDSSNINDYKSLRRNDFIYLRYS